MTKKTVITGICFIIAINAIMIGLFGLSGFLTVAVIAIAVMYCVLKFEERKV